MDPTVHETAIGHTESQAAALHWIALVFVAVWLGMLVWAIAQLFFKPRLTTREKRLKRMQEMKLTKRKKLDNAT